MAQLLYDLRDNLPLCRDSDRVPTLSEETDETHLLYDVSGQSPSLRWHQDSNSSIFTLSQEARAVLAHRAPVHHSRYSGVHSIQHLGFLFSITATVTLIADGTNIVAFFVMHSSFLETCSTSHFTKQERGVVVSADCFIGETWLEQHFHATRKFDANTEDVHVWELASLLPVICAFDSRTVLLSKTIFSRNG